MRGFSRSHDTTATASFRNMAPLEPREATHDQEESDWDSDDSENEDDDHLLQAENRPNSIPVWCPQATQNQSTYLTELPTEILTFIVGYLDSYHDFIDIALSCHVLRDPVEAPLYHSFPPLHSTTGEAVSSSTKKMLKFVLTLVRRPELGLHVRHLAEPALRYGEIKEYHLEPPEHHLLEASVLQLQLPNQEDVISALHHRSQEALLVLMLLKVPKLQTLGMEDLGLEYQLLRPITNWAIVEARDDRSQHMTKLCRVKIRALHCGYDPITFFPRFDFINRLPSFEEFTVCELHRRPGEQPVHSSEQLVSTPIFIHVFPTRATVTNR